MDRDDSLAVRLKTGNRNAATELVDAYYKQIYVFMRRAGYGRQTSEDLTQDCFLQAWQHIGQLKNDKALNSWLYRIAANVARQYWRKHKNDERCGIEEIDLQTDEQRADNSEELGRLNRAVAELSRKFREPVILHYMQHLTIAEAAEAAQISKGTFKSRLNRALKTLRKRMADKSGKSK